MKANDFVKLVFGYFADNPEAGLDFIEHIENRAELAASVQEDGNAWDKHNVVKADIIQHCGSDELPIARIVDDEPRNPTEWSKGSVMEEFAKSHPAVDAEQPKKKRGRRARVPKNKMRTKPNQSPIPWTKEWKTRIWANILILNQNSQKKSRCRQKNTIFTITFWRTQTQKCRVYVRIYTCQWRCIIT